jgi:PAS domain S-box-containing protein
MTMGKKISLPIIVAVAGASFGYFVISPFAMYVAHLIHMDSPIHEMTISDVFTPELFFWAASFTIFGGAIGLAMGLLLQRIRERTEGTKKEKEYADLVVNSMHDGMLAIDRDYKIVSANRAFLENSGQSLEEVIGRHCYEVSHGVEKPCNTSEHRCPFKEIMETGKTLTTVHTHLDKDGNEMYLELTASPVKDKQGNVVQVIELIRDITRRKRLENELKEIQELDKKILDGSPVAFVLHDRDLRVARVSQAYEDVTGYTPEEVLGKSVEEFMPEGPPKTGVLGRLKRVRDEGVQLGPLDILAPTKEERYVNETILPIFDSQGRVSNILSVLEDITKRKQAGEALREVEERLKSIVESSEDIIIMQDLKGKYLYYNAPPRYGMAAEDVVGKTPSEIHEPEMAKEILERIKRVVESGESLIDEEEINWQGATHYFHVMVSPIKDKDGQVAAITTILRNITEIKWAEMGLKKYIEDLEEANKMKDLFTDIMTHDLLSPAGAIRNAAELLIEDADDSQKEMLEIIEWGATKQMEIIELAGKLSRLKTEEELEKGPTDLKAAIGKAVEDTKLSFEEVNMHVENNVTEPALINANPVIVEVFSNLLLNAAKHAVDGEKVVIEIKEEDKSCTVMVKDFGPGIPSEDKDDIFERFKRKEKGLVKGTGLGLAIAKRVMDMHKGKIWVEDNPEGGSIFFVNLPK